MGLKENLDDFEEQKLAKRFFPYRQATFKTFLRNLAFTKQLELHSKPYFSVNQILNDKLPKDFGKLNSELRKKMRQRILDLKKEDKRLKSKLTPDDYLILNRFYQFFLGDIYIVALLICGGYYEVAKREMRYILEYFINAFVVDKLYEHENLQIKFGRIKDHYDSADWLFGRKLFERFGTILEEMGKPRILEDRTYEIYTKLSGKIHTSLSESADLITRYAKNPGSAIFPVHFYNEGKHSEAAFILNDVYGYIVRILAEFE